MSNNVKSRIQMKADTAANWYTAGENGFIPLKNEAIFYTDENNMKLGDGITNINQLDFFIKSDEGSMKYMGEVSTLPLGLTSADKGKTYLMTSQMTINNLVIPIKQTFTTWDTWNTLDVDLNEYINLIPNSANVYISHEVFHDGGDPTANEAMTLDLEFNFYDEWSEVASCHNGDSYQQSPGVCTSARFYIQDNDTTGFENETHGLSVYVDSIIIGDAPVNIIDGNKINKGDLIIWSGDMWNVIPSGDDVLDTTELKNEIIQEMEDYVDNAILNGAW